MRALGRVETRVVNAGTKSEHEASVLIVNDKDQVRHFILRRRNDNAFVNGVFDALAGEYIIVSGDIYKNIFLVDSWYHVEVKEEEETESSEQN